MTAERLIPHPDYLTSCPDCGKELVHHVGPPEHAPWLCDAATDGCGYAFWPAQLTREGRLSRRPRYRDHAGHPDHGYAFAAEMHAAMLENRADAEARGCSVLPEFVTRLTPAQMDSLVVLLTPREHEGAKALLETVRALRQQPEPG